MQQMPILLMASAGSWQFLWPVLVAAPVSLSQTHLAYLKQMAMYVNGQGVSPHGPLFFPFVRVFLCVVSSILSIVVTLLATLPTSQVRVGWAEQTQVKLALSRRGPLDHRFALKGLD